MSKRDFGLILAGIALMGVVWWAYPRIHRSGTISKIEQAQHTIETLQGNLRASQTREKSTQSKLAALQTQEQRLAEQRGQLDAAKLPTPQVANTRAAAIAVFQRYQ